MKALAAYFKRKPRAGASTRASANTGADAIVQQQRAVDVPDEQEQVMTEGAFPEQTSGLEDLVQQMEPVQQQKVVITDDSDDDDVWVAGDNGLSKLPAAPKKKMAAPKKKMAAPKKKIAGQKNKAEVPRKTKSPSRPRPLIRQLSAHKAEAQSAEYQATRFAREWDIEGKRVTAEANSMAESVERDERNAHGWVMFVRCRSSGTLASQPKWSASLRKNPRAGKPNVFVVKSFTADGESARRGRDPPPKQYFERGDGDSSADDADALALVEHVRFQLHPSFVPSSVTVPAPPFQLDKVGWGTFEVGVEVLFKDGRRLRHFHELEFPDAHRNSRTFAVPDVSVGGNGSCLVLEIGNQYSSVDEATPEDSLLHALKTKREKRRALLANVQARYDAINAAGDEMHGFLESCTRKQLALGALMAAILEDATKLSRDRFARFYDAAQSRVRYVVLDEETLSRGARDIWMRGLYEGEAPAHGGAPEDSLPERAYAISKPLPAGESIDRFVSHSWGSDAGRRFDLLLEFSREFEAEHGRLPRLWLDKFSIHQTKEDLDLDVRLLPLFLLSCDRVLVLLSKDLPTRLWCLAELYTKYALSPGTSFADTSDVAIDYLSVEEHPAERWDPESTAYVSVHSAHCSLSSDEELLRANLSVTPGGLDKVDECLNAVLKPRTWDRAVADLAEGTRGTGAEEEQLAEEDEDSEDDIQEE